MVDWRWSEVVAATPALDGVVVNLYRRAVAQRRAAYLWRLACVIAGAGGAWGAAHALPGGPRSWATAAVSIGGGLIGGWFVSRLVVPYVDLTGLYHLDRSVVPFWLQRQPRCSPWTFRSVLRLNGARSLVPIDSEEFRFLLSRIDDDEIATWGTQALHCELLYEPLLRGWLHDRTDGSGEIALRLADLQQCPTLGVLVDTVYRIRRRS